MTIITALALGALLAGCKQTQPDSQSTPPPAPSSPYAYRVLPPLSQATPSISEIDLNDKQLSAPGSVSVLVKTSEDVTSVTASLLGHAQGIPKIAPGQFGAVQQLPDVPFFLKGRDYSVEFTAATGDGRTANAQVVIHLKR